MGKNISLPSLNNVKTLPNRVYLLLEDAILRGKIKQGDRLIEDELSAVMGVSRAPIREAFRLMEKEGLIKIIPHKGAIVSSISRDDVADIYEVSSVLEGLAAGLFCKRATEAELRKMKNICRDMETQIEKKNLLKFRKLNRDFHEVFINGCANKKIKEVYNSFQKQIHWFQNVSLSSQGRPEISLKEHKNILDALLKKDSNAAEHAAREHVRRAANYFLSKTDKGKENGTGNPNH
ncbi:MAG: GntR family transcriptional regulator [Deltaproteobacteria bacterium]|nr:GntR family transcriptional regulator [Deltaproteobacteria bacterium]